MTTLKGGDADERIEEAARGMHEVALCTYAFIKVREEGGVGRKEGLWTND